MEDEVRRWGRAEGMGDRRGGESREEGWAGWEEEGVGRGREGKVSGRGRRQGGRKAKGACGVEDWAEDFV